MLKQGLIQMYAKQLHEIQQQQKARQIGKQEESEKQNRQNINYCPLVQDQIFQKQFKPFFIDNFSKQSSLKLFKSTYNQDGLYKINKRLRIFYQVFQSFKTSGKKDNIFQMLRMNQLKHLVAVYNQQRPSVYVEYFEVGKQLSSLQVWRFKHTEEDPHIAYVQREKLFNDFQLLIKFISLLMAKREFASLTLKTDDILILKYDKCNQFGCQYQIKGKVNWLYHTIESNPVEQIDKEQINQNYRHMILKLLGIPEQKSKLNQLQLLHFQIVQRLHSFEDIGKLKYIQLNPHSNLSQQNRQQDHFVSAQSFEEKHEQRLQQINELRHLILNMENQAHKEFRTTKVQDPQPKIIEMTQQKNKKLWLQIQQFILRNVSESQRKNLLITHQNKLNELPSGTQKKRDRKNVPVTTKKDSKPEARDKTTSKAQSKSQIVLTRQKMKDQLQIAAQSVYLGSGSSIKFRPQKLANLIVGRQALLYFLKTKNKTTSNQTYIVFFTNAKLSKQHSDIFGGYCEDPFRKSFIYSQRTARFHTLLSKDHAVGYGPQIFLAIGKIDIIIPCFGTQTIDQKQMIKCVSYFPISYCSEGKLNNQFNSFEQAQQYQNKDKDKSDQLKIENQIGLQKQFYLQQIDIYQMKLKVKQV